MLLECNHYKVVRKRYFNVSSLHELFDMVSAQNILGFIRYIGLYRLLYNLTFIRLIDFVSIAIVVKYIVNNFS